MIYLCYHDPSVYELIGCNSHFHELLSTSVQLCLLRQLKFLIECGLCLATVVGAGGADRDESMKSHPNRLCILLDILVA